MPKCSMRKPEPNSKTLPTKLPLMEGQQKETQYPRCNKETTRKGLLSREDGEVSQRDEGV